MTVSLSSLGGVAAQFFDNNGVILSGGKIYTYAAGTTTPQATYTSMSGVTPHANPIILDSAGRVPGGEIWLTDGLAYKFVLQTSTGILLGTYDNIAGGVDASMVIYDPPFINSVVTNVEAKLSECLSVYDFGAVGDGVTSDSAAFNLAIAAALAAGVALYIPPGNFYLATAITPFTLPSSAALRRPGRTLGIYGHIESSVITYAATGNLFDVSIQDNITPFTIQGLRIRRDLSTFASIPAGSAIKISGIYGFRIQDVVVTYFDTAVELAGSLVSVIDGLWAGWCLRGIRAYEAAGITPNQIALHNTKISSVRDYGIWVTGGTGWTFDSITIEGCGDIPNAIKVIPIYLENCGKEGGIVIKGTGACYYEANYADYVAYITHSYECQYSLTNMLFNRANVTDSVINDILFNANALTAGNSPGMLDVRGSSFNSINGDVRHPAQKRIAVLATAGWDLLTVYTSGATGLNRVDAPVWAATVRVHSPAREQVAKARFNGTTTTLASTYNISTFTKNGVGDYNFTFIRPVDYAEYSLNFTAINSNCVMKVVNEINTGNELTTINVVTHVNGVATDTEGILEVTGDTL